MKSTPEALRACPPKQKGLSLLQGLAVLAIIGVVAAIVLQQLR